VEEDLGGNQAVPEVEDGSSGLATSFPIPACSEPLHCNNGIRISFEGPTVYLTWQCDLRRLVVEVGSADSRKLHDTKCWVLFP